ncbi:hypothetical protein QLS31_04710 [Flavobacterium sp. XS2P24]|nr:hypothetical protein [Flavobacterium sp. XS2P24]
MCGVYVGQAFVNVITPRIYSANTEDKTIIDNIIQLKIVFLSNEI